MDCHFRIFQLREKGGEVHLVDAQKANPELFRYHDGSGNFDTADKAQKWVNGLASLQGQFTILNVITKKHR